MSPSLPTVLETKAPRQTITSGPDRTRPPVALNISTSPTLTVRVGGEGDAAPTSIKRAMAQSNGRHPRCAQLLLCYASTSGSSSSSQSSLGGPALSGAAIDGAPVPDFG